MLAGGLLLTAGRLEAGRLLSGSPPAGIPSDGAEDIAGVLSGSEETVSYTHLDVYKRQLLYWHPPL